jgi:hypothetical protein
MHFEFAEFRCKYVIFRHIFPPPVDGYNIFRRLSSWNVDEFFHPYFANEVKNVQQKIFRDGKTDEILQNMN